MRHYRLAPAAAAVALLLSACGKGGGPQGPPPLSVDAAPATRGNIATFINLDGQVAPLLQSTLAFQQNGPITAVYVNVGDRVSAGQLLARIDASTLQAELAQDEAALSQASATARGATMGLPVQVQTNNATLSTARAALDNARLVYNQNVQLYKQGYVSQTALQNSQAQYVAAQQAYNNAQVGLRNNSVSAENVKAQQAAAQTAAAQANVLRTQIGQTALFAPFAGVVTQRLMDPGAMASPSTPVLSVSQVDNVWININVPDTYLEYVKPGAQATLTSSSLPGKTFQARIQNLNAVPTSGTLSYLARVQMPNPGDVLRGGMLISATIPKEQRFGVILVPRSAVAEDEKGSSVFTIQDGKAVQVPVRVGLETDTQAEVVSDKVTAGTKVITTRPDALKDGSVVAVNGAPGAPGAPGGGAAH
ncbi:MAG: efflux RND transporter periplasmic adaptor subunit [Vulcanimicrobiaceae bacterium]